MSSATLTALFIAVSQTFSLPPGLLSAVCFVESGHRPNAHNEYDGGSPSLGVCQIKLSTARLLGFKGTEKELKDPENNVFYAGKYLASQLRRYSYDPVKGIAAYNSGSFRDGGHGLPKNFRYTWNVISVWVDNLARGAKK